MLEKISHTCIAVNDLDRSVAFYRDVIGCEVGPAQDYKNSICVPLQTGGDTLELMKVINPESSKLQHPLEAGDIGTIHVCFQVNDIEKHVQKVKDAGSPVTTDLHDMTMGSGSVIRVFYFRDPDGYALQFLQLPRPKK